MAGSTFQTNPFDLNKLLEDCHRGVLQLPDFQRSWVWDEDRIKSLIASVSRAFPVGALMSLDTGGPVNFKPRPVEGAPTEAKQVAPQSLLLDGQQRMTSLYQVTLRGKVVETVTPKKKKVKRWFYIDIRKALDPSIDREEAIVGVPRIESSEPISGVKWFWIFHPPSGNTLLLCTRFPRSLIGTSGKTASTSTGAATRMRAFVKNFGLSSVRFWRISNTTACRSLPWIDQRPRKPCALSSRR